MVGLRLHSAVVVENVRGAVGWIAGVIVLLVMMASVDAFKPGRTGVCERGIRNTFAREARTGDSGRIVRSVVVSTSEVCGSSPGGDCSAEPVRAAES